MNVLNSIEMRKSVRRYEAKPIEEEKMQAVIQAGNLAPIFGHFHITVIENPELLKEINDTTLEMMKHSGDEFLQKRAATKGYAPLYGAPAVIVLSAPGGNDSNGFNMANVSCAAENMIIEATHLGLGTCFVMGPMIAFADVALTQRLQIPEGNIPLVGVTMGYSANEISANTRKTEDNITYFK